MAAPRVLCDMSPLPMLRALGSTQVFRYVLISNRARFFLPTLHQYLKVLNNTRSLTFELSMAGGSSRISFMELLGADNNESGAVSDSKGGRLTFFLMGSGKPSHCVQVSHNDVALGCLQIDGGLGDGLLVVNHILHLRQHLHMPSSRHCRTRGVWSLR